MTIRKVAAPLLISYLFTVPAQAKTYHIALDTSQSNGIVESKAFAGAINRRLSKIINTMQVGDYLTVYTFGSTGFENANKVETRLTKRVPRSKLKTLTARTLHAVTTGKIPAQSSTNILAFVEFGEFTCSQQDQIILVTDGFEASSYFSNLKNVLNGKAGFPEPQEGYLSGCHVTMLGVGRTEGGYAPAQLKNLITAWRSYFAKAGASFTAIVTP